MKQLLFTVIEREGDVLGHTYKVYTNGEIEGFKPGSIIMNRYPLLESLAVNEYRESSTHKFSASPVNGQAKE